MSAGSLHKGSTYARTRLPCRPGSGRLCSPRHVCRRSLLLLLLLRTVAAAVCVYCLQGRVEVYPDTGELKLLVKINAKSQGGAGKKSKAVKDLKQLSGEGALASGGVGWRWEGGACVAWLRLRVCPGVAPAAAMDLGHCRMGCLL